MVNDVTTERLRRLTAPREHAAVLSLFLDLDPSQLPTPPAREAAVDSLLSDARRTVDERALDHEARARLREELTALEQRLRPSLGMTVDGARALAAFVTVDGATETEVLRLPVGVRTQVVLDGSAHVEPLVPIASGPRWCVALVNRRGARFHLGDEHALTETGSLEDEVRGQHAQGGRSQAKYQSSIEEDVAQHLDHVAHALMVALAHRKLFDRLLLACPHELRGALTERLHPDLRTAFRGWIDVDQSAVTADEVRRAAAPLIAATRREREEAALARLEAGVGAAQGHGVHGVGPVLGALNERRVETLLIDRALHPVGARCPECGLLAEATVGACPADGTALAPVEDLAEAAIACAYRQDAQVLVLTDEPRLATLDGIGAVLRF